jgi:hypothetical protein
LGTTSLIAAVAVAVASVAGFVAVVARSALLRVLAQMPAVAVAGVTAMLNPDLDDEAKELAVRHAGLQLLGVAWRATWRLFLALVLAAIPMLVADRVGLVGFDASLSVLMRIDFIVILSILGALLAWALRRRSLPESPPISSITDTSSYGAGDRLIHAVAFSGPGLQKRLARFDDWLFASAVADIPDNPPIFITSLARGGTTALLNAMHDLPLVASHRYCDMPFISAPMLWSRVAGRHRRVAERERAHGDGLRISLQSPEAFDEILWMLHWPEKYSKTQIALWQQNDFKVEAQSCFRAHFRKIVQLRHPDNAAAVRYLSKNNANIARLDLLPALFPGCQILLALREPSAHAASLHRQHLNFTRLHATDEFAQRYMRDIAHLEFGALHRPLAFDLDLVARYDPGQPSYWLAYWIAAFEHIRLHLSKVLIVSQEHLRSAPQNTMGALLDSLGITQGISRDFNRSFLAKPDAPMRHLFEPDLLRRAGETYEQLVAVAVK